jgi:hypothetical protein
MNAHTDRSHETRLVASVNCKGRTSEEANANAQLMAAAPDLLAAALALVEFWDNGTPVQPGAEVVADLRVAIAKAKA